MPVCLIIKFMNTIKIFISVFILGNILFLNACYYDKGDLLYPGKSNGCDTTAVSYNLNIMPLLNNQCYTCHIGSSASGGIVLGTYISDKTVALSGKLYSVVNHDPGFSPMPKGGAKLNTCQLAQIKKWIDAGTPNN